MRALPDLVALTSFSTELREVNICLNACKYKVNGTLVGKRVWTVTHPNQKTVSEEAVPRVLRIIPLVLVQQQWPLITADNQFATSKPLLDAKLTSNKWSGTGMQGSLLIITSIQTSRTKELTCHGMMESIIHLDVPGQRWKQGRITWGYPIHDNAL